MQNNSAVGGYILWDWRGEVIRVGAAAYYGQASIIMVEAWALRDGIREAIAEWCMVITIEGDNMVTINALKGWTSIPWQIPNVIEDVWLWLSQNVQYEINHIYHETNMAAN